MSVPIFQLQSVPEEREESAKILDGLFLSRVEEKIENELSTTPSIFVKMLRNGASGAVLRSVVEHIPKPIVVETMGSDPTNFSKLLRKKNLSAKQTEELNDLTSLWHELRVFFGWDENLVNDWIETPLPALEGDTPDEIMGSQYGRDTIRQLLLKMRFGEFS